MICQVINPMEWERWPEAKAILEPAQRLGNFEETIEPDEALLAILEKGELLGCATVWQAKDYFEVKLIGGRDHRRWIHELDEVIGLAAKRAGARMLLAIGRPGWMRSIKGLGWVKLGETDDQWVFAKEL